MANLVMLAGGTGDQSAAVAYGCVVDKDAWDAGSTSDFCGTDGAPIDTATTATLAVPSGNQCIIAKAGAFTNVPSVTGLYAYIDNTLDVLSPYGFYEIKAHTDDTITISDTNLGGDTITIISDDVCDVSIGGAFSAALVNTVIENCNDVIANDITSDSVHILYNIDESISADLDLDTDGTATSRIYWKGTNHTDSEVDGENFQEFSSICDKDDFPEITATAGGLKVSGYNWTVEHIHIDSSAAYKTGLEILSNNGICNQCWIEMSNANGRNAVSISYSWLNNCVIDDTTTDTSYQAIYHASKGKVSNNIVTTVRTAIGLNSSYSYGDCSGNILIGDGGDTGILVSGLATGYGLSIGNNSIYNFSKGIDISQTFDLADTHTSIIYNNIIWGPGTGTGIENSDTETCTINISNNFIGNVTTEIDSFGDLETNTVSLSAIPFTEASPSNPEDFHLNDTAGGGALVKGKMIPMDFDLDGTQDNWSNGAVTAEPVTDIPAVADVLDTATVGGEAGTYHSPDASEVWHGAVYGPSSGVSGTFRASNITNCEAGNVKDGVEIDDVTGTYEGEGGEASCDEGTRFGGPNRF